MHVFRVRLGIGLGLRLVLHYGCTLNFYVNRYSNRTLDRTMDLFWNIIFFSYLIDFWCTVNLRHVHMLLFTLLHPRSPYASGSWSTKQFLNVDKSYTRGWQTIWKDFSSHRLPMVLIGRGIWENIIIAYLSITKMLTHAIISCYFLVHLVLIHATSSVLRICTCKKYAWLSVTLKHINQFWLIR